MTSLYRLLGRQVLSRGTCFKGAAHFRSFSTPLSNNNNTEQRPFRILGLQQIAVGSTSRDELLHLWVDILGLEPMGTYVSEKENVDEVILTVGLDASPRHSVEIDLMVPLDANKSPKVCILFFYVVKSHFNSGERF